MAIEVTADLVSGGGMSETKDGMQCQRHFMVTGIEGEASKIEYLALQADGIPKLRDAHPSVPKMFCDSRSTSPKDPQTVEITCHYKQPTRASDRNAGDKAQPQIQIGASVVTQSTNLDADDNVMECERRNTADSTTVKQPVMAQVQVPQIVLRLQRKEENSPHAKARDYVGRVNKEKFYDGDEKCWLCTRIEGNSEDGGDSYIVTYEFQYNSWTWKWKAYYQENNLPVKSDASPEPILGYEIKWFDIYEAVSFSPLGLEVKGGGKSTGPSGFIGV